MRTLDHTITQNCGWYLPCLLAIFLFTLPSQTAAQNDDITLDIVLSPQFTRAQAMSLSNLGTNRKGGGAPLFNLVISNNDRERQTDLYLDIEISSEKVGLIAELYQQSGQPFSLRPRQRVTANNNQLQRGLPGVRENFGFNGGLTDEGEELLNSLEGSTQLPADIYTVVLSLYQGNNSRNGGRLIASVEQTFGENIIGDGRLDLYLIQPGGELGSEEAINTTLPVFRWEGPPNLRYRLLVVEDNGQSAEALLQSAFSSSPIINRGRGGRGNAGTGNLLDFEIVDAVINNTTFVIPPSGIQELKTGERYYWQVYTNRETVNGTESSPSEIWEFVVASDRKNVSVALNRQVRNALRTLLGEDRYEELREQGFQFSSIVIDGQTLRDADAVEKLRELSRQLNTGDISIVIN